MGFRQYYIVGIFEQFKHFCQSFPGGKDSVVILHNDDWCREQSLSPAQNNRDRNCVTRLKCQVWSKSTTW